jgi:hypothetical protein
MNWFAFRYYWFVWLFFITNTAILLYFILTLRNKTNCDVTRIEKSIEIINKQLDSCCSCNLSQAEQNVNRDSLDRVQDSIPKAPTENCAVHFTGLMMGGSPVSNNISKVYVEDNSSEYVGSGFYPNNLVAFPKAVNTTFDGIAIAGGAHLIIYSKPNFQGSVLLNVVGPKIINNVKWKDDPRYDHCMTDVFPGDLESKFPRRVRVWSNSDMHSWSFGSCKIYCE